jgi:SlyX protein
MQIDNKVDQRLTELEIKSSFAEDLLDQLNQIIVRQQQQLDLLAGEVVRLRLSGRGSEEGQLRQLADDLPPHY